MPVATDPTGGIRRRRSLVNQQLKELGMERQKPQSVSKFARNEFARDEEKPSASKKAPRRSLLTRILSLIGGPSRPGNRELTAKKARTILTEGRAQGQPLSAKQKRFFGAIAGGEKPRR